MTTLKEALESLRSIRIVSTAKKYIAEQLLGRYKGILPSNKTSTQWLKEMRANLYGKVK